MIDASPYDQINLPSLNPTQNSNKYNRGFTSDADESGIDTAYSRPSSVNQYNMTNSNRSNLLNNSNISFDMLTATSNMMKTRYDVKSQSSSSLYGSNNRLPAMISVNTNGMQANPNRSDFQPSTNKNRIKKFLIDRFFKNDAYSEGEYMKNENSQSMTGYNEQKDNEDKRENWSGRFDFFLSCLGYAVGLGAVWRFPYLCYKNGGGVFLIPYTIFLFLVGIPLFYLELNIGQFSSQGSISCWKMAPIFKGLGISMNIASFYFCIYYNMIIAYSLFFLFNSFRSPLDWSKCNYLWASLNCTDDFDQNFIIRCDQADVYRDINGLCYNYSSPSGKTPIGWWDIQKRLEFRKPVMPSQDYFNNYVLQKSDGLENSGEIVPHLVVSLLVAWILVFLCVFNGIKSSGKVVYFTSLFPYVVLIILGINGWTLPGAGKGIEFYIKPDFSKLIDVNVWFDAAVQIFFTMSTSYGGLITLASYNKFNQNTLRDTFIITLSNSLTAIFAGFIVFAYIGYLADLTQQSVQNVVSSGSGLSFIVFPFAVTKLAGAPFWAVIFFLMMLTLGLDSEFASFETIITSLIDVFPKLKKFKLLLTASLSIIMFLLGLPYCTRGGQYWIEIMDKFSAGWAVLIIGALECICISWVYGRKKFMKDIAMMIGDKCLNSVLYYYWSACWMFISPFLLFALVIVSWIQYQPLRIDDYVFPDWANVIGWLMTAAVLMGMIGWVIYCLIDITFINPRSIKTLFQPEASWGPIRTEHKKQAIHLKNLKNFHEYAKAKGQINVISLPTES